MSVVRFIADLHLGHENMAIKRGFESAEIQDEFIVKQWNAIINKRDTTYILGDITMETKKHYPTLDRLNGRKIVVLGNHDMPKDTAELMKYVEKVAGMIKYKGMFLTHCPIHTMELDHRISRNIHGHIHENQVMKDKNTPDPRYHCVSCERVDYIPRTLLELGIER